MFGQFIKSESADILPTVMVVFWGDVYAQYRTHLGIFGQSQPTKETFPRGGMGKTA